ncbi:MAG TPA: proton-conducting transporter membrane subunit [Paraburkholderia sp.]|uniref:complex I subunit 5 family protein n=1 Tax=Paraburkholderia sp. TaxID=1926495 RepID=UPI002CEED440|nr:proton-conducting transporter membrane subunit [Paraburkholderia sp.]HTR06695.1 proton-conducting transporter membrane subunit [Paraburkholderia sp.]
MTTLPLTGQATPGGLLLVLAVLLPFAGMLAGLALGGRHAQRVSWVTIVCGIGVVLAIAQRLLASGDALRYLLGGWSPPLGVMLRADGLSVCMMVVVAVVVGAVAVYANGDFGTPAGVREARGPLAFWLLLLAVWGALNLVFVSGDIFTLYVALELLTFAGVPLVSLDGRAETLQAALRYLVFALIGSMLYLLGVFLLYGTYGTLDIALLAGRINAQPLVWAAVALMTAGMLAKTALFPLHLWLPPAHAGAPAAASALLSALVVKGSWFLVVRLWFDVFAGVMSVSFAQVLAALGATAIVVGNLAALRQVRLKLLIAYSTVAQIGYLFLMFPLAVQHHSAQAVTGGLLQAISHATAKAAMFLAAGLIYATLGHDRLADLRGAARALPMTVTAFALAGAALIGLPPSGGFLAKWLLMSAALATGQWWWALVMLVGGLLTSIYVFMVVVRAMEPAAPGWSPKRQVPRYQQMAVLGLALCSFLLGVVVLLPVDVAQIGRAAMPATVTGMP